MFYTVLVRERQRDGDRDDDDNIIALQQKLKLIFVTIRNYSSSKCHKMGRQHILYQMIKIRGIYSYGIQQYVCKYLYLTTITKTRQYQKSNPFFSRILYCKMIDILQFLVLLNKSILNNFEHNHQVCPEINSI